MLYETWAWLPQGRTKDLVVVYESPTPMPGLGPSSLSLGSHHPIPMPSLGPQQLGPGPLKPSLDPYARDMISQCRDQSLRLDIEP